MQSSSVVLRSSISPVGQFGDTRMELIVSVCCRCRSIRHVVIHSRDRSEGDPEIIENSGGTDQGEVGVLVPYQSM